MSNILNIVILVIAFCYHRVGDQRWTINIFAQTLCYNSLFRDPITMEVKRNLLQEFKDSTSSDDNLTHEEESDSDISYTVSEVEENNNCQPELEENNNCQPELEDNSVEKVNKTNNVEHIGPNFVTNSSKKKKKHFCIYCKKLYINIPRHLETMHPEETEVKNFILLPKLSFERKKLIDVIRKRGDYEYNTTYLRDHGDLIVCRRPSGNKLKTKNDFITCPHCKGYMAKNTMYQHYARCNAMKPKNVRNVLQQGKALTYSYHSAACEILKTRIYSCMREDSIFNAIRYDRLITLFGNKLCHKYRSSHFGIYIRQTLRTLGRLLIAAKEIDSTIQDFAAILHPMKYDVLIAAVNRVADLNSNKYQRPTLASNIGTFVKKCAKLQIIECIKVSNEKTKCEVENFMKILSEDYGTSINTTAIENQKENKRSKKIVLPTTNDIEILINYLESKRDTNHEILQREYNFTAWLELSKCCLCYIIIFNRRRPGETERIKISNFRKNHTIDEIADSDVFAKLTDIGKQAARNFVRFEIRGKKGRTVPVLLNKNWFNSVELIIKHRDQAGVSSKNEYVFGIPGRMDNNNHLQACALLRQYALDCGAKNPKTLRGTLLRKHIATVIQGLNLNDSDMALLANYMGHDEKIHKEHYRLPIAAREITQMSNLLTIVEQGNIEKYNGLNLDQICHDKVQCASQEQKKTITNDIQQISSTDLRSTSYHTPLKIPYVKLTRLPDWCENKSTNDIDVEENSRTPKRKQRAATVSPMGHTRRLTWTTPERHLARKIFSKYLIKSMKNLPSVEECQRLISNHKEFGNRTAIQLRLWVHNERNRRFPTTVPQRRSWTTPQKTCLKRFFQDSIKRRCTPSSTECRDILDTYPQLFVERTFAQIKTWMNCYIRSLSKHK